MSCVVVVVVVVIFVIIVIIIIKILVIWQSPGLLGWREVYLITVTRMPHHLGIAADLYCLTTSLGFLPALCEK